MPSINRPRTLHVHQLGKSVRASVALAIKDREKEFGALAMTPIYEPQLDGDMPISPDPFGGSLQY